MNALAKRAANAEMTVIFLLLSLLLGACGRENGDGPREKRPPLVEAETIQVGPIVRKLDLSAEVVPVELVQLSSTVDGPIDFFPWREGDTVIAGEKLIVIDRNTYRAEVDTGRAALKVAQAKLADLRAGTRPEEIDKARQTLEEAARNADFEQMDLERIGKLVEIGAVPGEEMDKAHVRYTAAQAKLKSARRHLDMLNAGPTRTEIAVQEALVEEAAAKLVLAEARFEECILTAPFAGTITRTFVRPGDMALARTPLLEMTDMESLVLRFAVPEAHAMSVRVGMPLTFELDALAGETFSTEIVRVYPELDAQMRTRTVEAKVLELPRAASHMFARVRLMLEQADKATLVPAESIMTNPSGGHYVFVLDGTVAQRRNIEIGIEEETMVQVVRGVETGERVVVSGQSALRDGQTVRLPGAAASENAKDATGKKGRLPTGERGVRQPDSSSDSGPERGTGQ
jgi:HlyD family secretion protein